MSKQHNPQSVSILPLPYFFVVVVLLVIIALYTFRDLPKTFFQQDEWQFFGAAIWALASSNPILTTILPFEGQLTHFYPFSTLFFLFEYLSFGTTFVPYAIAALVLHLLNTGLVYLLARKLTRNTVLSLGTAGLFLVNSYAHQTVTWVMAATITLPAVLLLLLSCLAFVTYVGSGSTKHLIVSLLLLVGSLLFKEISLFLLGFLPFVLLLKTYLRGVVRIRPLLQPLALIFGCGFLYAFVRVFFLVFSIRSPQPEVVDVSTAPLAVYVYRSITIPLKGLAQSFFSQTFLINKAEDLLHLGYPQFVTEGAANAVVAQSIAFDLVCYIIAIGIVGAVGMLAWYLVKTQQKRLRMSLLATLLFTLMSFLPFIFVPGRAGYFSIFEPRNLYVASIGSSFMVVLALYTLVTAVVKNVKSAVIVFSIVLIPFVMMHIRGLTSDLQQLRHIGQLRESFLVTLVRDYPDLPTDVIIYTQSDRSYYGMPAQEKILPIQTGFGRMVLVWYQRREQFPACLYGKQFLQNLLDEGYQLCEGRGFGYFRSYDKVRDAARTHTVNASNVIAYEWNGTTEQFHDVTGQTRERLKQELQ